MRLVNAGSADREVCTIEMVRICLRASFLHTYYSRALWQGTPDAHICLVA